MTTAQYDCTVIVSQGASIRTQPNTNNNAVGTVPDGYTFKASALVPDSNDPTNAAKMWLCIFGGSWDGKYIAQVYPASNGDGTRCTYTSINTPPSGNPTVTHTVLTYSDGTISIDGGNRF